MNLPNIKVTLPLSGQTLKNMVIVYNVLLLILIVAVDALVIISSGPYGGGGETVTRYSKSFVIFSRIIVKLNIPLYCCLNDRMSCTGRNLESKHKQNSSINSEECYIKLEQKHSLKCHKQRYIFFHF